MGVGLSLYRVPVAGGEPRPVTIDHDGRTDAGAWTTDGSEIIFAGDMYEGGLFRIKAQGGKPQPLSPGGQFGYFPSTSAFKVIGLFTANRPMTRTSGDSICRRRRVASHLR